MWCTFYSLIWNNFFLGDKIDNDKQFCRGLKNQFNPLLGAIWKMFDLFLGQNVQKQPLTCCCVHGVQTSCVRTILVKNKRKIWKFVNKHTIDFSNLNLILLGLKMCLSMAVNDYTYLCSYLCISTVDLQVCVLVYSLQDRS